MNRYYQYQSNANAPAVLPTPAIIATTTAVDPAPIPKLTTWSVFENSTSNSPQIIAAPPALFTTYSFDNYQPPTKNWQWLTQNVTSNSTPTLADTVVILSGSLFPESMSARQYNYALSYAGTVLPSSFTPAVLPGPPPPGGGSGKGEVYLTTPYTSQSIIDMTRGN